MSERVRGTREESKESQRRKHDTISYLDTFDQHPQSLFTLLRNRNTSNDHLPYSARSSRAKIASITITGRITFHFPNHARCRCRRIRIDVDLPKGIRC